MWYLKTVAALTRMILKSVPTDSVASRAVHDLAVKILRSYCAFQYVLIIQVNIRTICIICIPIFYLCVTIQPQLQSLCLVFLWCVCTFGYIFVVLLVLLCVCN